MHVKNTDSIWTQVQNKITSMYQKADADASNWYSYGMDKAEFDKRALESVVTPELETILNTYGERMFEKYKSLTVRIPTASANVQYTIQFLSERYMPQKWYGYHGSELAICRDPQLIEIAAKRRAAMVAVAKQRDAFIAQAKDTYYAAASINALLKALPTFGDLLPPDVVQKVNRKSKPTAKMDREAELAEKTKAMAAGLLMAKVIA